MDRAQSVVGNVETGLPDRKCIRNAQKIMAGQLRQGTKTDTNGCRSVFDLIMIYKRGMAAWMDSRPVSSPLRKNRE